MEERRPKDIPPQHQEKQPGDESKMNPEPSFLNPNYRGTNKLKEKVAIITGGDSGIGRSVSVLYAREGAKVVIVYLESHQDAQKTKEYVEKEGGECLLISGDVGKKEFCQQVVQKTLDRFNKIDILVNHAGYQKKCAKLEDLTEEQLFHTFSANVFGYFFMTQACLPHLKKGSSIINTTSVNAHKGNPALIDYSATKGANRAFTYSLAIHLAERGIRVNAVAPGPIWTPFIPGAFEEEKVKGFGKQTLLGRPGQPEELSPTYVFLASETDSSYINGATIHVNGGMIVDS